MIHTEGYAGAVILTGREKSVAIMENMVLTLKDVYQGEPLGLLYRDRSVERGFLDLSIASDIDQLHTINHLDYFCVGAAPSFVSPLRVPSMMRSTHQVVSGDPWLGSLTNHVEPGPNAICKLLSSLNSLSSTQQAQNFADSVKKTLFDRISGNYNIGLFLQSVKSNFILAHRIDTSTKPQPSEPVLGMVITRDCVAVVWFDCKQVMDSFERRLNAHEVEHSGMPAIVHLVQHVSNAVCVIHPIHLVSKWSRSLERGRREKNPSNPFASLNIIVKHLRQSTLPLA